MSQARLGYTFSAVSLHSAKWPGRYYWRRTIRPVRRGREERFFPDEFESPINDLYAQ